MKAVVQVKDLETTFFLKSGPFKAVNKISYNINKGETLGIVGESGCGKSVTAFSLMRLIDRPGQITNGEFKLDDENIFDLSETQMENVRGGKIAMIFQEPMTALNPVLTIGYQMDEQIKKHLKYTKKDSRDRAIEMLQLVGIPSAKERYESYPHHLSGGMRQRAMIAMALSCNPQFLIADEPTTALDVTIQAQILELFQSLQEKMNMTVQFITHDLGVISEVSDKVMVMYGGHACETGNTQDIINSPRHPYTAALIESRPRMGHRQTRLKTIAGSVPAPHELPKGCPFANRCPNVLAECWNVKPSLQTNNSTRAFACFNPL